MARRVTRVWEGNIARKTSIDAPAERPLVSVIVPAFNAARAIERALDSVLADGRSDLECVVVDDGSSDDTAAVVGRRAAADPRIALLRSSTNEGVSAARNRALSASRGEWLAFLDADDRVLPRAIGRLLEAASRDRALVVVGQRIWSNGWLRWQTPLYDTPDVRAAGRKSVATHPGLMRYASATGKLFHRSVTEGLEFEGRVLGDQPWTIRAMIRAGDRIQVIDDLVYEWIRPARRTSSTITAAKLASAGRAADAVRQAIRALADVAREADARIPDPALRDRLVSGYFERLVRSDLGGAVRRVAGQPDEGGAELFDAIWAFLAAAPPGVVDRSAAVAEYIVRAPLDRWPRIGGATRRAYLRGLRDLLERHPGIAGGLGGPDLVGPAVRILRASDSRVARVTADVLLTINWPLGVVHRLRRFRPPRLFLPWSRR